MLARFLAVCGVLMVTAARADVPRPAPALVASEGAKSPVEVTASAVAASSSAPIVGLAFSGGHHLLALTADRVVLYRRDRLNLVPESELTFAARGVVRRPGGLLAGKVGDSAFWAATSRLEGAVLLDVTGGRVALRDHAPVCPWPDAPRGLRFRTGTNLLEGTLAGLTEAPLLAVGAGDPGLAVSATGRLGIVGRGWTEQRVGGTVAPLWPAMAAASTTAPPGTSDAIVIVRIGPPPAAGSPPAAAVVSTIPVDGSVRALAAVARDEAFLIAAAVEDGDGARILLIEVTRAP